MPVHLRPNRAEPSQAATRARARGCTGRARRRPRPSISAAAACGLRGGRRLRAAPRPPPASGRAELLLHLHRPRLPPPPSSAAPARRGRGARGPACTRPREGGRRGGLVQWTLGLQCLAPSWCWRGGCPPGLGVAAGAPQPAVQGCKQAWPGPALPVAGSVRGGMVCVCVCSARHRNRFVHPARAGGPLRAASRTWGGGPQGGA